MKMKIEKTKLVAAIATVLLIASIGATSNYYLKNKGLISENKSVKLKSEKMLSEKLLLDKEIYNLKNDITSLSGRNRELDGYLSNMTDKIAEKEAQIAKMTAENKKVKSLQKELNEIRKIRIELDKQLADMKILINNLKAENAGLSNQIVYLQNENEVLNQKIKSISSTQAGNFRVETTKGKKDKLTIRARKTDKFYISFDVPKELAQQNTKQQIHIVITAPDGNILAPEKAQQKTISSEDFHKVITPSASKEMKFTSNTNRVSMAYAPKDNLKEGIYQIEIYNDQTFLGNAEIKLRK